MAGSESFSVSGNHLVRGAFCRQFLVRGAWPLAYFYCVSKSLFCSLGGGEVRFGVEGSQFVEGRYLSPIPCEGNLQPIVCFQPARSVEEGFVSGSVAM